MKRVKGRLKNSDDLQTGGILPCKRFAVSFCGNAAIFLSNPSFHKPVPARLKQIGTIKQKRSSENLKQGFELHPKSWTHPLQLTRCSFFMSKYTLHFKYQAVLHYLHIRSQQRTADHYGISRTHLRRWIRAYQEGGIGALEHPQSKTMPQHRKNPFIADKPDQEKTQAELIEELCYMRAEVAYLKELKALSQKQTAKDKAKPSKH